MKKFILIATSLMFMLSLTGCSNVAKFDFWIGFSISTLTLIYIGAFIVGKFGQSELSTGLMVLGYIMAGLACGVALVLYGIVLGIWWLILIAIALFVVYIIVMKIFENNW